MRYERVQEIKDWLMRTHPPSNQYYRIPNTLFDMVTLYGISAHKAREIFQAVAIAQEWHLTPCPLGVALAGNVEGGRGKKRIMQWFLQGKNIYSHFRVLVGGSGVSEGG